jgi:hypothetical protein
MFKRTKVHYLYEIVLNRFAKTKESEEGKIYAANTVSSF